MTSHHLDTVRVLESVKVPYCLIGSSALCSHLWRHNKHMERRLRDVDVLISPASDLMALHNALNSELWMEPFRSSHALSDYLEAGFRKREFAKNIYGVRYSKDEEYPINTIDFILHFPPFDVNEVIGRAHVWDNSKYERILYARIIDLLENKKIASQSTQRVKKREQDLHDFELLQMLIELDGQALSVTP